MRKRFVMRVISAICLGMLLMVIGCTQPGTVSKKSGKSLPLKKLAAAKRLASKPFPQNLDYAGCIKPKDQVNQEIMNTQVKELYVDWVTTYVKPAYKTPGGYYVQIAIDPIGGGTKTTSEEHGQAMVIFALMAGVDLTGIAGADTLKDPKTYFDGMFHMYKAHPSVVNPYLMSWSINYDEDPANDSDSSTSGDMDIAYALVMAHDQWGSHGAINYIHEAQKIVTFGIKESDMCPWNKRVMLGDWSNWTSFLREYGTRPSDWMVGHLRVFYKITGDDFWLKAIEEIYRVTDTMQREYAPQTGLISDFVVGNYHPKPAYEGWWPSDPSGWLEGPHDADYAYNAGKFPMRIALDYAHYGEQRAKSALDKIASWVIPAHTDVTGDPPRLEYIPASIVCGYHLDGTKINWNNNPPNWPGKSFMAPFTLACMVNPSNQDAVDKGWWEMVTGPSDYYDASINVLSALLLTGNWWKPAETAILPTAPTPKPRYIGADIEDYQDYVPASYNPPMGLSPDNVPMFVTFSWNDNQYPEGLDFVRGLLANRKNPRGIGHKATYDDEPVSNTFFHRSMYGAPEYKVGVEHWKPIYDRGIHETANHSYDGKDMTDDTPATVWQYQINKAQSDLAGILGHLKLYGWRTPELTYGPELFGVLKQEKYWYDTSIEEGYQIGQDGTNFLWPYTLDNGSPGHDTLFNLWHKHFPLEGTPGLWEMPVYCFIVPPVEKCGDYGINYDLREKIHAKAPWFYVEDGKIHGTDETLWFTLNLTAQEVEAILMYTLDLRMLGNRAPLLINADSDIYTQKWQEEMSAINPGLATIPADRKHAITNFFDYALSKPDVRMVNYKKVLEWLRRPIGLTGIDPCCPTPTPTAIITPTPTQLPLVNIAPGNLCVASSEYSADFMVMNVNDDNDKSIWATTMQEKASYLYIDLGALTDISGINIQWFDKYYATKYKIYLSGDGKKWNEVLTMTNNASGDDKLIAAGTVKTRYVGLYLIEKNDAAYAIKEFQVLAPQ